MTAHVAGRDEWTGRAAELVPVLARRAQHAEESRTIPKQTIDDLVAARLLRVPNPDRHGGFGLDLDTAIEVAIELGRGCGSTAWCYSVWSSHTWMVGLYGEAAQEEYFADSCDVLCSSSFDPSRGKAEQANGGYLLTGRWGFSSGCDAATWAMLAAPTADQGAGLFLVPSADYRIDDTWFTSGLRGTGSKDIVIDEPVKVPAGRFLPYEAMKTGRTPGGMAAGARPMHRLPFFSVGPFVLAAPLLGIAQGAIDRFEEQARPSASAEGFGANPASTRSRLAASAVEIHSARALLRADLRELIGLGERRESPTFDEITRYHRDATYVAKLTVTAVNRLFEGTGGAALHDSSPLQRAHRDVHAGSHHVALRWDTAAEQYGRVRLGIEPFPLPF